MDICITLDYELHLGRKTGSVQSSLIFPLNKLIEVLDNYKVRATIFIDTSYLQKLKAYKDRYSTLEFDYQLIVRQLKELSEKGHSLQLHLHPQWHYSDYDGKEWILDFDHYKLSDMAPEVVPKYFLEAKGLLESIVEKKVIAYRAGGYSLQSYSDHVNLLVSNGIKYDSSVVPGKMIKSKSHWYDYRGLPRQKYKFSETLIHPTNEGLIAEIPISTVTYNPILYFLIKEKHMRDNTYIPYSDGRGITEPVFLQL
jgi:peptidoglycan/xylan/chitin deacetylase (PgdA/CDA1 family)